MCMTKRFKIYYLLKLLFQFHTVLHVTLSLIQLAVTIMLQTHLYINP